MAPALGEARSAPYSRMGATRDIASLYHRYGARPAPGGLRRLMSAKAPWTRANRPEKWAEESRAGVNQYPCHLSESRAGTALLCSEWWRGTLASSSGWGSSTV